MPNNDTPMRLLITGGRDFVDYDVIERAILDIDPRPEVVIHGDAAGADRVAGAIAEKWELEVWKFPANWARYGKSAGPRRNYQMLQEGRPTHVLAFPGGRGTENMVKQASKAGLPIRRIYNDGLHGLSQRTADCAACGADAVAIPDMGDYCACGAFLTPDSGLRSPFADALNSPAVD